MLSIAASQEKRKSNAVGLIGMCSEDSIYVVERVSFSSSATLLEEDKINCSGKLLN